MSLRPHHQETEAINGGTQYLSAEQDPNKIHSKIDEDPKPPKDQEHEQRQWENQTTNNTKHNTRT